MQKSFFMSMSMMCIFILVALGGAVAYGESDWQGMDLTNPEIFPFPPNGPYGAYEPSITADEKTIYFAQFPPPVGNPANQNRDIYVSYKVDEGWTEPEKLPYPINSEYMDTEPMISPDGRTLIFMSDRPGGMGSRDFYIVRKDAHSDGWGPVENMGYPFNTEYADHCLILTTTTSGEVAYWASTRPGGYGGGDIWASMRSRYGEWSEPWNAGPVVNNAGNQCRFVPGRGNLIGVVTDHDAFHHQDSLVRYDPPTQSWAGPRILAGWMSPDLRNDGCGNFTASGRKWIWASGRDLPPGYSFPDIYNIYWIYTESILDYYEDTTGISVRGN